MNARWGVALAGVLFCSAGAARPTSYAIAIGNNAPPVRGGAGLPVLRFADDDAVRLFLFFGRFTDEARLLTVLDSRTQQRHSELVSIAQPPTMEALQSAARHLAARVREDVARGDQPVVYVSFSGHGGRLPDGTPFLAMSDGELTREWLRREVLAPLSDAFVHLSVDACYAEDVVGTRGLFDQELSGRASAVTASDVTAVTGEAGLGFPKVGTLVATSPSQESYEWSQIEHGVFTHELLSGLAGAADANGDGVVDYAEIAAFLAAANTDVDDPRARPQVTVHAPSVNARLPIVSLGTFRDVAFLVGDLSTLAHFAIQLDNGERYLDAHLSSEVPFRIAFPAKRRAVVIANGREAPLFAEPGETRLVSSLVFQPGSETARTAVEPSLRSSWFASAFGPSYLKGFEDGQALVPQTWEAPSRAPALRAPAGYRKPMAVASWAVAGLSLAASATSATLAMHEKHTYESTDIQRAASQAAGRYSRYRTAAIATGVGAVTAGLAGWLFWPREKRLTVAPLLGGGRAGVVVQVAVGELP